MADVLATKPFTLSSKLTSGLHPPTFLGVSTGPYPRPRKQLM